MMDLDTLRKQINKKWQAYWDTMEAIDAIIEAEERDRAVNKLLMIVDESAETIINRFKRFYLIITEERRDDDELRTIFRNAAENNKKKEVAYGELEVRVTPYLVSKLLTREPVFYPVVCCFVNGELKRTITRDELREIIAKSLSRSIEEDLEQGGEI